MVLKSLSDKMIFEQKSQRRTKILRFFFSVLGSSSVKTLEGRTANQRIVKRSGWPELSEQEKNRKEISSESSAGKPVWNWRIF